MLPENVADVRRGAQEEPVPSLAHEVKADALKLGCVDSLEVEVVDCPLQPVTDVGDRPL